jgi:hypothetical protein
MEADHTAKSRRAAVMGAILQGSINGLGADRGTTRRARSRHERVGDDLLDGVIDDLLDGVLDHPHGSV